MYVTGSSREYFPSAMQLDYGLVDLVDLASRKTLKSIVAILKGQDEHGKYFQISKMGTLYFGFSGSRTFKNCMLCQTSKKWNESYAQDSVTRTRRLDGFIPSSVTKVFPNFRSRQCEVWQTCFTHSIAVA